MDFPGGTGDKNSPASAEDEVLNPGLGRFQIPRSNKAHVPQLLNLSASTTEACASRACALQ